jgi:phosphoribosylformylglycinamidine cyclo-ligase
MSAGMLEGKGAAGRSAYTRSGVDVEAGDRAVELMRAAVASTNRPEVVGGLGGFGGAIAIPVGYREPLLVSSTDGVGTKTAIARATGRYDGLGIDLVAMCADDVVCAGAEPLFFLDYVAVGRLDPERIATIVGGVAAGCRLAGCALVGGETAEHPGIMAADELDLAGACTGVVERSRLIDGSAVEAGDAIVGFGASGLHSNGFSLVRSVVADAGWDLDASFAGLLRGVGGAPRDATGDAGPDATLGDVLLTPTRIYARAVLRLRDDLEAAGGTARGTNPGIHGLAHITGGGLPGNVPRALPAGLGARLDPARWPLPPVMRLIATAAGIDDAELRATFNGGLGMVAVVPADAVEPAIASLARSGVPAWRVGEVAPLEALGGRYVEGPLAGADAGR